jgi:hypothetical protein
MSIDFILIFNIHINFIFVKEFFNNLLDFIIFFSLIFKLCFYLFNFLLNVQIIFHLIFYSCFDFIKILFRSILIINLYFQF